MTTDADRLFDLDEALGRIGALAYRSWNEGTPSYGEVVEEVVLTCEDLLDETGHNSVRAAVEFCLPDEWLPDENFQERLRKFVEVRRASLRTIAAQQARISELEEMTINDPLIVDPVALARLRMLLRNDPRIMVITQDTIQFLKETFGVSYGPTSIEPAVICPACDGTAQIEYDGFGAVLCVRCEGAGKVPDTDNMRMRLAELEIENDRMREVIGKGLDMMAWMRHSHTPPPEEHWLAFDLALGNYRNCGYVNSDHPDDFTAPQWSAGDPEPEEDQ